MTEFVRVRCARLGDPLHEFDIPVVTLNRHADHYKVIDSEPVAKQRPASHIPGTVSEKRPHAKRGSVKNGEDNTAPSEGLIPEEES